MAWKIVTVVLILSDSVSMDSKW